MSGSLMEYSGLVTKTKAMSGRLLREKDYNRLMEYETVELFLGFLKESYGYAPIFAARDEITHRGQVETVIRTSLYEDYRKLYRFAHGEQKTGLELLFFRYEVDILKNCLKYALLGKSAQMQAEALQIESYASFDVKKAAAACSMDEMISAVSGSPYEKLFRHMAEQEPVVYADAAFTLDIYYYKTAWKRKEKIKDNLIRKIYNKLLGTEIDWQNIMWIYRSKRFFSMSTEEIAANLIPIACHIHKQQLKNMAEADSVEAFLAILEETPYFSHREQAEKIRYEETERHVMEQTYIDLCRKYPMSLAPVLKYLYDKEQEIDHLTSILEGIRYQLLPGEIKSMVFAM